MALGQRGMRVGGRPCCQMVPVVPLLSSWGTGPRPAHCPPPTWGLSAQALILGVTALPRNCHLTLNKRPEWNTSGQGFLLDQKETGPPGQVWEAQEAWAARGASAPTSCSVSLQLRGQGSKSPPHPSGQEPEAPRSQPARPRVASPHPARSHPGSAGAALSAGGGRRGSLLAPPANALSKHIPSAIPLMGSTRFPKLQGSEARGQAGPGMEGSRTPTLAGVSRT